MLEELVAAIDSVETLAIVGTVDADTAEEHFDFDVDRATQSFAGELTMQQGETRETAELVRTSKLTWLRASDEYWRAQGFDEDSVDRSRGKYVVFDQDVGDRIAKQYNLSAVFESLVTIDAEKAEVEGVVDFDGTEAHRFDYAVGSSSMLIDVPATADRVRLISEVEGAHSTFVMSDFGKPVHIEVPDPGEVMQPEE